MTPATNPCARHSAPRPPTGFARLGPGDYAARAAVGAFAGLPAGISHPLQLLEPLRDLGHRRPFPAGDLVLLERLVAYTGLADWQPGAVPLAWPSNDELAGCLGQHPNAISRSLARLRAAGAIAIHYGPGNRRHPVFGPDRRIVAAYGIDLRPLVALAARVRPVVAAQAERRRQLRRLVADVATAARACRQHADAAGHPDMAADADAHARLTALAEETAALLARAETLQVADHKADDEVQAANDPAFAALAAQAAAAEAEAAALVAGLIPPVLSALNTGAEGTPTTDPSQQGLTCRARQGDGKTDGADLEAETTAPGPVPERTLRPPPPRLSLPKLAALSPVFADRLHRFRLKTPAEADPEDLELVGRLLASEVGLSVPALQAGLERHGGITVALAALAAAEQPAHQVRRSRGALLAGMLRKAPADLNPLASLYGLAARRGRSEPS